MEDMESTLGSHDGLDVGGEGMSNDDVINSSHILFPWEHEGVDITSDPPSNLCVAFELLRVAIEQCFTDQESYEQSVLARVDNLWRTYSIPEVQRDNALAMLTLLHVHVRCVVESVDGDDDDIVEEVSSASTSVVLSLVVLDPNHVDVCQDLWWGA